MRNVLNFVSILKTTTVNPAISVLPGGRLVLDRWRRLRFNLSKTLATTGAVTLAIVGKCDQPRRTSQKVDRQGLF